MSMRMGVDLLMWAAQRWYTGCRTLAGEETRRYHLGRVVALAVWP